MRIKFVLLASNYPNLKLLLLRRTLPELRENHILPLMGLLDGIAKYKDSEKAFIFPNKSRLRLGYCDTDKDVYQYQGQEYDVIGFEEATQFTEFQKDFILTCNRSTRTDFTPRAYYTANPGGPGHEWFKRLFIEKSYRGSEKASDYIFIPARVWDNPTLVEANPEYIEQLKTLPEHLRKAFLDGDWNVFAGQAFPEFRTGRHITEPFPIPDSWTRFVCMDWGFSKPYAVYWCAVDFDNVIYVYRELYGCKKGMPDTGTQETAREVAKHVKEIETPIEKTSYRVADPAIWAKTGHDGPSIGEAFGEAGIHWTRADNDRLQGKQQFHLRLRGYGEDQPGLKIFSTCEHFIRTFPALCYDEKKVEDVDTTQEDHAYDALRYGLMSRPFQPVKPQKPKRRDAYAYDDIDEGGSSWMGA